MKRMLEIHDLKNKRSCNALSEEDFTRVARHTKGYTGADLKVVCSAAAMEPIRDLKRQKMNLRFAESTDVSNVSVVLRDPCQRLWINFDIFGVGPEDYSRGCHYQCLSQQADCC